MYMSHHGCLFQKEELRSKTRSKEFQDSKCQLNSRDCLLSPFQEVDSQVSHIEFLIFLLLGNTHSSQSLQFWLFPLSLASFLVWCLYESRFSHEDKLMHLPFSECNLQLMAHHIFYRAMPRDLYKVHPLRQTLRLGKFSSSPRKTHTSLKC